MKITLIMATTINGYVAGEDDDTDWVKDLDVFQKRIEEFGAIIMGKRTYRESLKYNAFPYKGALNIVLTHDSSLLRQSGESVLFSDKTPIEIINLLKEKGYSKLLVVGGGHLNGSFVKENLVDEIIIDIHPLLMAKGINLAIADFPYRKLKLIEFKEINDQILQVKYKVIK